MKIKIKRRQPTEAEMRRAKDFWSDVFQDAILAQISDDSQGKASPEGLVDFAAQVANLALTEIEKRWTKI